MKRTIDLVSLWNVDPAKIQEFQRNVKPRPGLKPAPLKPLLSKTRKPILGPASPAVHPQCSLCPRRALYGPHDGTAQFCSSHKKHGMLNLSRVCSLSGCLQPGLYGNRDTLDSYCVEHKLPDMILKRRDLCSAERCPTAPGYGFPGQRAQCCAQHKAPGMINLINKLCEFSGCQKYANYGIPGHPCRFCTTHKLPDMQIRNRKMCQHENCYTTPLFAFSGEQPRFCSLHKLDGMEDTMNKRCEEPGCHKHSTFGVDRARFCFIHQQPGMENKFARKCKTDGCDRKAIYGRPGTDPVACAKHKLPGLMRFSNRRCRQTGCNEKALFGSHFQLFHCEKHAQPDEINYVEHPCKSCRLPYLLDNDGFCENCHPEQFQRIALSKQNALMDFLDMEGLPGTSTDRIIDQGACGKERPDRVYELHDRVIIVECDEHQHKGRECLCEQQRMVNIAQSFGGLRVCFLRFNPDEYRSIKQDPLYKRYRILADLLKKLVTLDEDFPGFIAVRYLFFDDYVQLDEEPFRVLA